MKKLIALFIVVLLAVFALKRESKTPENQNNEPLISKTAVSSEQTTHNTNSSGNVETGSNNEPQKKQEFEKKIIELKKGIKQLNNTDQATLDHYYQQVKDLIQSDETLAANIIFQDMNQFISGSRDDSFFFAGAWIRSAAQPTLVFNKLWEQSMPEVPASAGHHASADSPYENYKAIQAYALSELRGRIQNSPQSLSAEARESFTSALIEHSHNETSSNQLTEMYATLMSLGQREQVKALLLDQPKKTRKFIQEALQLN